MPASNTWTSTGDFYIRVNGKNGVASLDSPFTLKVTVDGNLCAAVSPKGSKPGPIANTKDTIILTDTSRFGDGRYDGDGRQARPAGQRHEWRRR